MFVSEYFLIFIRYIFQLNWNLSRHIGPEWHHSGSWAAPPRLMGCNKDRGSEDGELGGGGGGVDRRAVNEMQFGVNGSQKHFTPGVA